MQTTYYKPGILLADGTQTSLLCGATIPVWGRDRKPTMSEMTIKWGWCYGKMQNRDKHGGPGAKPWRLEGGEGADHMVIQPESFLAGGHSKSQSPMAGVACSRPMRASHRTMWHSVEQETRSRKWSVAIQGAGGLTAQGKALSFYSGWDGKAWRVSSRRMAWWWSDQNFKRITLKWLLFSFFF